MLVTRRIYVSLPADPWLSSSMNDLKWAIVDEIENLGYTPEIFTNPRGKPGLASSRAWGARAADEVARRCSGAAVIGMARWNFQDKEGRDVRLPTEFSHYEAPLPARSAFQRSSWSRETFSDVWCLTRALAGSWARFHLRVAEIGLKLLSSAFHSATGGRSSYARRDVFLGYCSSSRATAASLKSFLQSGGATVLDWQTDFIAGRSILAQIEEAAARCNAGIFLFTKDDDLADENQPTDRLRATMWCSRPAISSG